MSNYFYNAHQQHMPNPHPMVQSMNHHGRSRRNQRISSQQPGHRHHRHQQKQVEKMIVVEPPSITAFRTRFEAGRSFDLDDDMEFCPNLLTWDESVTSGSSDRSSLSSASPDSSPLQHQLQPQQLNPALTVSAAAVPTSYVSPPTNYASENNLKLHQPSAIRSRNPIPIVNPDTRIRMSPNSVSPNMMQQANAIRQW